MPGFPRFFSCFFDFRVSPSIAFPTSLWCGFERCPPNPPAHVLPPAARRYPHSCALSCPVKGPVFPDPETVKQQSQQGSLEGYIFVMSKDPHFS